MADKVEQSLEDVRGNGAVSQAATGSSVDQKMSRVRAKEGVSQQGGSADAVSILGFKGVGLYGVITVTIVATALVLVEAC